MIKLIISLLLLIFVLLIIFNIWAIRNKPTKYWFVRVLRLDRILPKKFENVFDIDIREVENLMCFLITHRCADENVVLSEIRNGYVLRYYPEGVDANKRVWPFAYVEIYDDYINSVLRVGFDKNEIPKYQIGMPHDKETLTKVYFSSHQGTLREFSKYIGSKEGQKKIVEKYKDWLVKSIL